MNDDGKPRVVRIAEGYLKWCERWKRRLERSPANNDQIQRAAASLMANIGEAFDADTLAEKRRYFRYALASAGEGIRLVKGVRSIGVLPAHAAAEALRLLRDVKWDLIRLIRWTQR